MLVPVVVAAALALAARPVPQLAARVTDEAGVLSQAQRQALEAKLQGYEQATGHQYAVLVIDSLDGEVLEQFSIKVAEQWRLGDKKRDDGLLLLVAIRDRQVRVEVGYGLEGAVPDAIASRVIRERIVPRFQAGDVPGGIDDGIEALMAAGRGENLGPPQQQWRGTGENWAGILFAVVMVLGTLLSVPRLLRAPGLALLGAIAGWVVWSSTLWAGALAVLGFVLGIVLPVMRGGRGRRSGHTHWHSSGWGSSSSSSSGGGFGGFSGGGGSFGGGGASGRW